MAVYVSEESLNKLPDVHLFLNDQSKQMYGHLVRGVVNPKIRSEVALPSKFKVVFLKKDDNGRWAIDEQDHKIETRAEFFRYIRNQEVHVGLSSEDGKFISCRKAAWFPLVGWTSLTEYRPHLGDYEIFRVRYHYATSSFSFQSHNELYLQANYTFWTAPCRAHKENDNGPVTSWHVSPLLSSTAEEERIEFVGAADICTQDGESDDITSFLEDLSSSASGGSINVGYMQPIADIVANHLQNEQSTHFCGRNGFRHYFLRSNNTLFMVVTTNKFSVVIAGALVDDLKDELYEKYFVNREKTSEMLTKHGLNRLEVMKKELEFRMIEYDDQNHESVYSQTREVVQEVEENIMTMHENMNDHLQPMAETAEILLEQAEQFKKRAKKLRKKSATRYVLLKSAIGLTLGGGLGALGGWLIGGPFGTAFLATQGAEIGAGVGVGAGVGTFFAAGSAIAVCMWKNYVAPPSVNV